MFRTLFGKLAAILMSSGGYWAVTDCLLTVLLGEKSTFFEPKVSKNLNWAILIKNLLGFNDAGVTNLQYFCGHERDCLIVYTNP